jgi:uncharacterized delta-60 repeat protein
MLKKFLLIFFIILSFALKVNSQVAQEWVQKYNGPAGVTDVATSIAVDAQGNVYTTGYSTGNSSGHDYATIKYNSAGIQQWAARYNGPGNALDDALDIAVDGSGNVYVTGKSAAGATEYTYDYATIKYNSTGVEQWVRRYGTSDQDVGFSITVDEAGNVYVTGQRGHPALDSDIGTVKYNSAGVEQWAVTYNRSGNWDTGNSITVDGSGNVYVTGFQSVNWGTAYLDFVTIKYNSSGVQQWTAGYNGTGNNSDQAIAVGLDALGNVYITGYSVGTVYDIATIKYNNSGVQQWVQRYSSSGVSVDVPSSMAVDPAGNIYITGAISFDFGTLKYNSDGVQQWIQRYDFNGNFDAANSLAIDGSGNVYVTGVSGAAPSESTNDYATLKYNTSGVQQWVMRFNSSASDWDEANSIGVDGAGNVYVTGFSTESSGADDYCTIKYSETVGTDPVSNEVPNSYSLSQNYPNPFNPVTNIRFAIPTSGFVSLKIFNVLGTEIASRVNEQLTPGIYEVSFDASDYSSGVYYYKLSAGDYSKTKKMILIK